MQKEETETSTSKQGVLELISSEQTSQIEFLILAGLQLMEPKSEKPIEKQSNGPENPTDKVTSN